MISLLVSRLWTKIRRPRIWTYFLARLRRFRTPKQLRDADFHLWVSNLNKCSNCFYLDPLPKQPTCDLCGCNVELKTRWMSERCPIEEWDNTIHLNARLAELAANPKSQHQSQHPISPQES